MAEDSHNSKQAADAVFACATGRVHGAVRAGRWELCTPEAVHFPARAPRRVCGLAVILARANQTGTRVHYVLDGISIQELSR
jgi:hypothetical protein